MNFLDELQVFLSSVESALKENKEEQTVNIVLEITPEMKPVLRRISKNIRELRILLGAQEQTEEERKTCIYCGIAEEKMAIGWKFCGTMAEVLECPFRTR